MKKTLSIVLCLMMASVVARAQEHSSLDTTVTPDTPSTMGHSIPDNTRINKRDRDHHTLTPGDQSSAKSDIKITRTIRKSLMKQSLSVDAKNIKVITRQGGVTLRGPVKSSAEVEKIVALVKAVPGVTSTNNQLEVK